MKPAIVIVSGGRPTRFSGGPDRIAYVLLKNLLVRGGFDLYYLSLASGEFFDLPDEAALKRIVVDFPPKRPPQVDSLVRFFANIPLINQMAYPGFSYLKLVVLRLKGRRNLNRVLNRLGSLADKQPVVLHLHLDTPVEDGWVSRLHTLRKDGRVQVLFAEHGKGSILKEWEQIKGPSVRKAPLYISTKRVYDVILEVADRIIFPSKAALELVEDFTKKRIDRNKLRIIYNGIFDTPFRLQSEEEEQENLFVTVAAHVPEKGLDLVLEGLSKLQSDWQWEIIGEETIWTPYLIEQIKEKGLEEKVRILGRRPLQEVLERMRRAKAVIMMQRVAVFDLVLLEAMALGKLILAGPVGGNKEALGEEYPLLVPGPEDLPRIIEKLKDKDLVKRIKQNNRRRYEENFTEEKMIQNYIDVYLELVAGRAAG